MKKKLPLVSVIINCYNGEQYLNRSISSIISQTYTNWELVFWDNASTDRSAEIYKSYRDNRFKYYKSEINVVLGQARAWAVEKCKGDYIAFLDVDDEWLPDKLEIQIQQMIIDKSYLSYSGMHIKINEKISSVSIPKYSSGYIFGNQLDRFEINMPSSVVKAEVLRVLNLNFDSRIVGSEEYDLFIQIAAKYKITVIKKPLCIYRINKSSLTNSSIKFRAQDKIYTFEKLEKKFLPEISKHQKNYRRAKAKIYYYEFQKFYKERNLKSAKNSLKKITRVDYRYLFIYLSLLIYPKLYGKLLKIYDYRGI